MRFFSPPSWHMKKRMIIKKTFEESHEKPLQTQAGREITYISDPCLRQYISEAKQGGRSVPTNANASLASVNTCILFFSDSSKEPLQDSGSRACAWPGRSLGMAGPREDHQFGKTLRDARFDLTKRIVGAILIWRWLDIQVREESI